MTRASSVVTLRLAIIICAIVAADSRVLTGQSPAASTAILRHPDVAGKHHHRRAAVRTGLQVEQRPIAADALRPSG